MTLTPLPSSIPDFVCGLSGGSSRVWIYTHLCHLQRGLVKVQGAMRPVVNKQSVSYGKVMATSPQRQNLKL